jgi:crossover junction endodeoxyribonuclease RusA
VQTWSLWLPWRTPPLTLNQRLHHMAEYRLKQQVKQAVILLARQQKIPHLAAISAELRWLKADNRKADSDNIAATLKPALDGLVAAGVLDDDDSDHVLRTSTKVLLRRDRELPGAHVVLHIRDLSGLAVHR